MQKTGGAARPSPEDDSSSLRSDRWEYLVAGDEVGDLSFSPKALDSRFGIVTARAERGFFADAVLELGQHLANDFGTAGRLHFHATEDGAKRREQLFELISSYPLLIDVTVADKVQVPTDLRQRPAALLGNVWAQHLAWTLPSFIGPATNIRVEIAEMAPLTRTKAFREQITPAMLTPQAVFSWPAMQKFRASGALLPMPGIMYGIKSAQSSPAIQVADYCAWAVLQSWRGNDRYLKRISSRISTHEWAPGRDVVRLAQAGLRARITHSAASDQRIGQAYASLYSADFDGAVGAIEGVVTASGLDPWHLLYVTTEVFEGVITIPQLRRRAGAAMVKAVTRLRNGDVPAGIASLLELIVRYNFGTTLNNDGDLDAAIAEFEKALALDGLPDDGRGDLLRAKTLVNYGNALARSGQNDRARRSYQAVLDAHGQHPGVFREPVAKAESRLAMMDWSDDRGEQARARWHRIVELFEDDQDQSVQREVRMAREGLARSIEGT